MIAVVVAVNMLLLLVCADAVSLLLCARYIRKRTGKRRDVNSQTDKSRSQE